MIPIWALCYGRAWLTVCNLSTYSFIHFRDHSSVHHNLHAVSTFYLYFCVHIKFKSSPSCLLNTIHNYIMSYYLFVEIKSGCSMAWYGDIASNTFKHLRPEGVKKSNEGAKSDFVNSVYSILVWLCAYIELQLISNLVPSFCDKVWFCPLYFSSLPWKYRNIVVISYQVESDRCPPPYIINKFQFYWIAKTMNLLIT